MGIYIVAATGRIRAGMPETLRNLHELRYRITTNGANVYDSWEDRDIYKAEIDPELAVRVYEYLDKYEGIYDCYKDNWGYISRSMYEKADRYVPDPGILDLVKRLRCQVDDLKTYLREKGEPVQKLQMFFGKNEERLFVMQDLPKRFPELCTSSSVPANIEINVHAAEKGAALAALCRYLGILPGEVIAFGDGTNDASMIKFAGLGVAMGNAQDEVKAAADIITETCDNAGVADIIERILADQK